MRRRSLVSPALVVALLVPGVAAPQAAPPEGPAAAASSPAAPAAGNAACHAVPEKPRYAISTAHYEVPDVALLDQSGRAVSLRALLESGQPVALNFIFTTCTTICPVMTATFAQMRRELGKAGGRLRMVSISIDPEFDRPEVLRSYARRYGAAADWTFLTGNGPDVTRVLRAFGAYSGSKMNHRPLTLLKGTRQESWVRIEGLASGGDLAHEVHARLLGSAG
jgi:protein SCO1/2